MRFIREMNDIDPSHLLDVAVRAAKAAGQHAVENRHRRKETSQVFDHDIKLVLDLECQRVAEKTIADEFPEHAVLGEENIQLNPKDGYEWIIDPIDGTVNFSYGMTYWCSSVAVRYRKHMLAGCVYAPDIDRIYTAHQNSAAQCNGEPIRVSQTRSLDQAMVLSGLSKFTGSGKTEHFELFRQLALRTRKMRINGAAALDLCHVAAGDSDGYLETDLYLWDHAAAGLIARQAGAEVTIYPNQRESYSCGVICSNTHLMDELLSLWKKYGPAHEDHHPPE